MRDLAGRNVLITGGANGLGLAYAQRLAGAGAAVAIADIDASAGEQAVAAIRAEGDQAVMHTVDITVEHDVRELVDRVVGRFGSIDVLINNAGRSVSPWGPMEDFTLEQWSRTIALNLTGTWLCSQAVVPIMKKQKNGKIINVSTTIVSQGYPTGGAPYVAAKAGVVGLTRTLAKELGPFGITVNAVAPGLVPMDKGNRDERTAAALSQMLDSVVSQQAIHRIEEPDDLSGVIEFLVSDSSDFITGQVLNVDGGWALG